MQTVISFLSQRIKVKYVIALLPLLAAILLEAHIRFLSLRLSSTPLYLQINLQLLLVCLPFLIAHAIAFQQPLRLALMSWLLGFIAYPILIYALGVLLPQFAQWHYLAPQGWALCTAASLTWLISQRVVTQPSLNSKRLSTLISLDNVVLLTLLGGCFLMAGVLNTHEDPLLNQPFNLIFDPSKVVSQFGQFITYFWQLGVYTAIVYGLYLFNRYFLIRHLLAVHGVFLFVAVCVIVMLVLTPLLIAAVLSLPINDLPHGVANLTPSGDQNIFSKFNYQFMLLFLVISTPIILAFERQQQQSKLNEVAKQQTQTELKLLQQQVNPHFLFNTLNNLYALTLTKSEQAPQLVLHLADLLRYTVYEGQKSSVPLAKELDYLKNFIELQKIRSANKCKFNLVWPHNCDDLKITPLLLIIIVENAIKHGVEPASDKTHVSIEITINDNVLTLYCTNPIPARVVKKEHGMGLANLQKRLQLLYPNKHSLITHKQDAMWQTTLTLEL
ncbi:Two-component system, unclassified family, sensor kinase [Pseudoalteromonas sp. 3J6]|uniref:sensor histidine kinase n=1 Tax=Pseudoalteromonas sp. 3J6 TaxID=649161 RepID=UPI00177A592D|nr:histidine kinase [Pseudoalteromonas sp. 3J6]CAD2223929.1 Two-component system, unclassified family, sensor kinase [Pseudoalteromonas sp. 3J6]